MTTIAKFDVLPTLGAAQRTSTALDTYSGAAVDLQPYVNPGGRQLKALLSIGATTTTGSLNVKLQQSSTTAEAGFADIGTTAAFTSTADSGSLSSGVASETIHFRTNSRYVRALASGTGGYDFGVYIVAERRIT